MTIMIVVASQHGSTREIAEAIPTVCMSRTMPSTSMTASARHLSGTPSPVQAARWPTRASQPPRQGCSTSAAVHHEQRSSHRLPGGIRIERNTVVLVEIGRALAAHLADKYGVVELPSRRLHGLVAGHVGVRIIALGSGSEQEV